MKLVTYLDRRKSDTPKVGTVAGDKVIDLGGEFKSVLALIEGGEATFEEARSLTENAKLVAELSEVKLIAPIPQPRRNVFCVGWNYLMHFEEGRSGRGDQEVELPEYPTFFDKPTTTVTGPYDDVPYDSNLSEKMDYEAELAMVIGRAGRSIPAEEALQHIFGYAVANDVSIRDVQQRHGGQWLKGKGMDESCPIGPWIVTADEVTNPQDLDICCYVNGVKKQSSNTRHMIFPVAKLIEELSLAMTLLPGDIILTGTPEGVGFWKTPPEHLIPGDEMRIIVSGVGEIRNRIVERSLTRKEDCARLA